MEAGWNDVGDTWHLVQPEIAELTRVCSYDRAGLGNSEPGPEPRTMLQVANELHTLLQNAGVEGPYILVGHSWGGSLMRLYTDLYQEEVVGLVLVDSSHPDTFQRNLAVLPPESPDDSESLKFYRNWFSSAINDP
jgi:pimeloyl-ACP methyl ester carboxylesterase